ncbi:hypothetical protein N8652_02320 [bacterium]|nr:hypothetical protein [bacterium]
MNVLLVTGCLLVSPASVSGQVVASEAGNESPPASLRPTFSAGQVSVRSREKESPPVTLHAADKALQAWLATQPRKDVIENTLWTS